MISGVTKQIDGSSETFRMTTRAMMAIEDHYGKGIVEVMQDLEDGFRIGDLVKIVSECAGNGAGVAHSQPRSQHAAVAAAKGNDGARPE